MSLDATFHLARQQCLAHAAQAFQVFGHTTLRGVLAEQEVGLIASGLRDLGAGADCQATVLTASPVEKSRKIQQVVFSPQLLNVLKSLLPPFWYYGSDACVGMPEFAKHRDTFFTPPFYKIFIPLVPCIFSVLPGSHLPGDIYSRTVSRYSENWSSGKQVECPAGEVHFSGSTDKVVASISYLQPENIFLQRALAPGDIFIFNQSAVHGLSARVNRNFFLAISVVPSPVSASIFGLKRKQHLKRIIANIATSSACEYQLAKRKGIDPGECLFDGYKFGEDDMRMLTREGEWHDLFGLRFIEKEVWRQAFDSAKSTCWEHLQNHL